MAAQSLQKRLEASAHEAAKYLTHYLHVADPARSFYYGLRGWGHKADLHLTGYQLLDHGCHAKRCCPRA